MQRKPISLSISVPKRRLLTWLVSVLFFLPQPLLARTMGDLEIVEDTTLTENHQGNIIILANRITLDCNGHTVSGRRRGRGRPPIDPVGILLTNRKNVTIKNCHVRGFNIGIGLNGSKNNELMGNTATRASCTPEVELCGNGFVLFESGKNKLTENTANDNGFSGFLVIDSKNNRSRIAGLTITISPTASRFSEVLTTRFGATALTITPGTASLSFSLTTTRSRATSLAITPPTGSGSSIVLPLPCPTAGSMDLTTTQLWTTRPLITAPTASVL